MIRSALPWMRAPLRSSTMAAWKMAWASLLAISCSAAGRAESPDFSKQVLPLLTKAGCNTGACHGAAAGRGYLQLSLFGSRPADDYEAIVHAPGRRIVDLGQADQSLLLQKPCELLEHGGGERLRVDSAEYGLLKSWIDSGAVRGSMSKLARIELLPAEYEASSEVFVRVGQPFSIGANAVWRDGSVSEVSHCLAIDGASPVGQSGADSTAAVSVIWQEGRASLRGNRVGLWTVTLRVASAARSLQIACYPAEQALAPHDSQPAATPLSIDGWVNRANERLGLDLAGPADPHWMARRLWIDLLGRHPSLAEWQAATEQIAAGNKAAVVDRLLDTDEFLGRAAQQIAGWVVASAKADPFRGVQVNPLQSAIAARLAEDDRLLALARDMLRPQSPVEGLSEFHRYASDARTRAELVASVWMGVRIGCAQCHDHPLDHWRQEDYFAMAACWAEIESNGRIRRIAGRTTTDLRTGWAAEPRLPDGQPLRDSVSPDDGFSDWLCDANNDLVAHNLANRLWQWMFGRGIVVDEDDHRETNPPDNRALLNYLVGRLRAYDFRLRPLLREILLSDAYGRASTDAGEAQLALRSKLLGVRVPKAIVIPAFDELARQSLSVAVVAGSPAPDSALAGAMMQIDSEPSGCTREGSCSDPFSASLNIVAGPTINAIVADQRNSMNASLSAGKSVDASLDETYRRLFGNQPTGTVRAAWQRLTQQGDDREVAADIVWSWLVSDAFRSLR